MPCQFKGKENAYLNFAAFGCCQLVKLQRQLNILGLKNQRNNFPMTLKRTFDLELYLLDSFISFQILDEKNIFMKESDNLARFVVWEDNS